MKLKTMILLPVTAMCLSLLTPAFAADGTPASTEKPNSDAHARQLMNRLIEIRDMDKSNLTSTEKRALRKEVREMKKEVRRNQTGIYLSLGAIIIIVLLLL